MNDLKDIIGDNFDKITAKKSFEPIPAGKYRLLIDKAEWKESQSGGRYVNLAMVVLEGEYEGQRIFEMLNLVNHNETAVKIAMQSLKGLCLAIGLQGAPQSIDDLTDKPFWAKVKIQPPKGGYEAKNRIAGYLYPSEADTAPKAASATAQKAAPQAAKSASVPPWER